MDRYADTVDLARYLGETFDIALAEDLYAHEVESFPSKYGYLFD